MKLKPYPRYKSIAADWFVRLPSHWTIEPLGRTTCIRSSNVDKHFRTSEMPVRLCNYVDVYYNDHIDSTLNYMSGTATEDQIARLSLHEGDVVITKDSEVADDIGVPALVSGDIPSNLVAAYHLTVLRPDAKRLVGSYLLRALQSDVVSHQFSLGARGVTRYALSYSTIKSVWLPSPPLLEQHAIVGFLDHIVAKMDTLVEKILSLIEHLQEYRRALITEIVTRGLPPDENRKASLDACPKLKPSGVEGLGDVPEHWKIQRLRSVTTRTDRALTGSGGEERVYIGMEDVESWTGKLASATAMSLKVSSPSSRGFQRGDVLFGKLRPYLAKSCSPDFDGLCSGEFLVLEGKGDFDNCYLLYLLLSQYMVAMADAAAYGTKMPRTNWQEVGSLRVPVPPILEQRAICSYLDGATARIDNLVRQAQLLVDRLREKRQALITAAVTGQIDVRGEEKGTTE